MLTPKTGGLDLLTIPANFLQHPKSFCDFRNGCTDDCVILHDKSDYSPLFKPANATRKVETAKGMRMVKRASHQ
jgi:hypothetical protein